MKRILKFYQEERNDGELFKDFVVRQTSKAFEPLLNGLDETRKLDRESIEGYMDWDKTLIYKLERGEGECAV
jgi:hypothetical protein